MTLIRHPLFALSAAFAAWLCAGCDGGPSGATPTDGGFDAMQPDAEVGDGAACMPGSAACPLVEAGTGDGSLSSDAGLPADGSPITDAGVTGDAGACSADGPISVAGDYATSDGTQYWLRKSPTAATYAVVPAGAPDASALPQLFRIRRVCLDWLGLAGTDGSFARLDWSAQGSALLLCVRPAASLDAAAALPAPDATNTTSGCGGAAWITLAKVQ